jgi:hypothetical protein
MEGKMVHTASARASAILLFASGFLSLFLFSSGAQAATCTVTSALVIHCRIDKPVVTVAETQYNDVQIAQGDRITITSAGGCVQTGGKGLTWKRYVDPSGDNSDRLYHGLIDIKGATNGPVRIKDVLGRELRVPVSGDSIPLQPLSLGYEDDIFPDNSYDNHDDGTDNQCAGVGPAFVEFDIVKDPWTGWTEIPGGGSSNNALSGDFWYGKLFVLHTTTDSRMEYAVFDGRSWSPWKSVASNGVTSQSVAAMNGNIGFMVIHTGFDQNLYYTLMRGPAGSVWDPWNQIPGVLSTVRAAAAIDSRGIVVFAVDPNQDVYQNEATWQPGLQNSPISWSGWTKVPGAPKAAKAPVAVVIGTQVELVIVDSSRHVHSVIWNAGSGNAAGSWSAWSDIANDRLTFEALRRGPLNGIGASPEFLALTITQTPDLLKFNGAVPQLAPQLSSTFRTDVAVNGAAELGSDQPPGMAQSYLFAKGIDGKLYINARGPISPFPPPPTISLGPLTPQGQTSI